MKVFECIAAVLALTGAAAAAQAQDAAVPGQTPSPSISIHGLADVYYAWNSNRPADHANFQPGTGTTAKSADEFALNLAALDVSAEAKPVHARIIAVAGNGAEVVHEGEPAGEGTGRDVIRHIYQASLGYLLPIGRGIAIDAGIYPSHIGFESFLSKDNWNYTRGWAGEFSPYYQAGVKVATSFSDHWSAQLHVINGWQIVGENNHSKTFGTQVAWTGDTLSVSFNTCAGPELPNDDAHWRTFGDLVVTYKAAARLQLAGSADAGYQARPGASPARWQSVSAWARYSLSSRTAIAARAEVFHDPEDGISGFAQTLRGGTVTLEHRPAPPLVAKLEARYDRSSASVFSSRASAAGEVERRREQVLLIASAVAIF